jgi:hypothetical protein
MSKIGKIQRQRVGHWYPVMGKKDERKITANGQGVLELVSADDCITKNLI